MTPYRPSDFCVIAAVDNDRILNACLQRSPDIASGALPLTIVRDASDMADAYNAGLDQTDAKICLFAHQDVYLPEGWLARAVDCMSALESEHPDWMVAGPYGVRRDGRHFGRVWDVNMGRELGNSGFAPTPVGSLDELLLILRRDSGFRFDPQLPHFHLYGTDLVQTALAMGRAAFAIELPVVHNNRPWASLGEGYQAAYRYALRKWRSQLPIHTTVCTLTRNPVPLWRVQWRRRNIAARGDELLADAAEVAALAGYDKPKRSD